MVDREWVLKIAKLARLELKEEEIEVFQKQLSDILDFIDQLKELDTENVEPYIQEFEETPMREDEPHPSLDREKALMNAPERKDGFFVVPRVVEV
ncbi:Asp-tRNA(Asn)/Glu-tRNA(Gln) amidotransferase subunit GatC [Aquifex aeolicus]|uniref:Glutamyl-tRNA(Gln) amidotransferase subunit C n=1 Tax=Aquifex aeolicus (strain VF5) TaxID=224324 RepID=GATC_AQUAE|nr:Asp-tRNA(Asn)/Glu-tRNA(Gln) amidotransferase subunit GatC [Aquifex aeolicus]O67904.1 RecName: Full=Glutamyl-tRNA(Gln) amidotransferase subunit C; Short=Glu-ADT subunit C [Aquifex aeolicus VF5]3H0L_C Chain C, Glutamyl-tRNA(Gln) amidotransferase subunit C [Aquifex aeolicus]3H0L_F Chain F, Glutamyl-tRNA(Gln) amidotransferase subunit C [Aquifex aeolicus]3H0L_I Chain I, Glutamyl-tRNA(Gln) amidotransferase subunit C [Aquifex aeolicus]3H0L_L Chain L, Glutamyl-tRNA(Gln) amidotransferase subunit C [